MLPPLSTPVLLTGYNRPDTIRRVVACLAVVRPSVLFVCIDGPKPDRPGEAALCEAVERAVREGVDWPCDMQLLRREENLGCGRGMAAAIAWFFDHVESGIILEDDILAGPDFFEFCTVMLDRFRNDERVWSIAGGNCLDEAVRGDGSYYFSKYVGSWGWAGWRRSWRHFERVFPDLDSLEDAAWWRAVHPNPVESLYWRRQFRDAMTGRANCWDYQWQCKCWEHGGLVARPGVWLTSNIGFGPSATHTKYDLNGAAERKIGTLGPLRHPAEVKHSVEADEFVFRHYRCPEGSAAERFVLEALVKQQHRRIKLMEKVLVESGKQRRQFEKELSWAAGHRWKAARRLLSGKWPPPGMAGETKREDAGP